MGTPGTVRLAVPSTVCCRSVLCIQRCGDAETGVGVWVWGCCLGWGATPRSMVGSRSSFWRWFVMVSADPCVSGTEEWQGAHPLLHKGAKTALLVVGQDRPAAEDHLLVCLSTWKTGFEEFTAGQGLDSQPEHPVGGWGTASMPRGGAGWGGLPAPGRPLAAAPLLRSRSRLLARWRRRRGWRPGERRPEARPATAAAAAALRAGDLGASRTGTWQGRTNPASLVFGAPYHKVRRSN